MSGDGLLGRAELERAFAALGDRLVRRGVVADLFIVGGAAMALAYDAQRVTRDVDAVFVPHGVVLEEARNVATALGLPPWWLNEQASTYVSTQHDAGKREVFDHPGIRVLAASPEHVFAMKAFAARTRDEDPSYAEPDKDFGQGFYATTDRQQAVDWAQSRYGSNGTVMHLQVSRRELSKLNGLRLKGGTPEYNTFVRNNRLKRGRHNYDWVEGPMVKNVGPFKKGKAPVLIGQQYSFNSQAAAALIKMT